MQLWSRDNAIDISPGTHVADTQSQLNQLTAFFQYARVRYCDATCFISWPFPRYIPLARNGASRSFPFFFFFFFASLITLIILYRLKSTLLMMRDGVGITIMLSAHRLMLNRAAVCGFCNLSINLYKDSLLWNIIIIYCDIPRQNIFGYIRNEYISAWLTFPRYVKRRYSISRRKIIQWAYARTLYIIIIFQFITFSTA